MTPLRMKVDGKSLEVSSTRFVQPSMEYANIVQGASYDSDILKLKNIHFDAGQLVTGATARLNIINVHEEFGCYNVSCWISMLFKCARGKAPQYLINILLGLNG